MERDERRRADALDRYWNDLLRDGSAAPPPEVDPIVAGIIDLLREPGTVSETDAARERVRRHVHRQRSLKASDLLTMSGPVGSGDLAIPQPNGRVRQQAVVRPPSRFAGARRWPLTHLATAALLLVTLAGLYIGLVANRPTTTRLGPDGAIDWPMFRGNAARTGAATGAGPAGQPVLQWTFAPELPIHPAFVVAKGTLYLGGDAQHLYALDAATGAERWRFSPGAALTGVPTVAHGVVYVGSRDHNLYAVDTATGREMWHFATGGEVCCSPLVDGGTLYVGSLDGTLYAIDLNSRQERWTARLEGGTWSSPAVANGTVFVGDDRSVLHALDAATGQERWQAKLPGRLVPVPAVADGTVYAASWDGALYAFDAATGAQRWRFVGNASIFSPAVVDGTVYAGSNDGSVYALDAATGAERWSVKTGDRVDAQPAVANGVVYAGSHDGYVYALDAKDGTERWRFPAAPVGYGPLVVDGVLYLWTGDGKVIALGGGGESPPTGTPISEAGCGCTSKELWSR